MNDDPLNKASTSFLRRLAMLLFWLAVIFCLLLMGTFSSWMSGGSRSGWFERWPFFAIAWAGLGLLLGGVVWSVLVVGRMGLRLVLLLISWLAVAGLWGAAVMLPHRAGMSSEMFSGEHWLAAFTWLQVALCFYWFIVLPVWLLRVTLGLRMQQPCQRLLPRGRWSLLDLLCLTALIAITVGCLRVPSDRQTLMALIGGDNVFFLIAGMFVVLAIVTPVLFFARPGWRRWALAGGCLVLLSLGPTCCFLLASSPRYSFTLRGIWQTPFYIASFAVGLIGVLLWLAERGYRLRIGWSRTGKAVLKPSTPMEES